MHPEDFLTLKKVPVRICAQEPFLLCTAFDFQRVMIHAREHIQKLLHHRFSALRTGRQQTVFRGFGFNALFLVGGKAGIILNSDGIEQIPRFIVNFKTILQNFVGENLRRRQRHSNNIARHLHCRLRQIDTGTNDTVI